MQLREAMAQISEIRMQMARTTVFRGYRSVPVAFSGCLAIAGASFQSFWISQPVQSIDKFLELWIALAIISALAAGAEMTYRQWRLGSRHERELTWLAVEQFLPSVVAGTVLTAAIVVGAPDQTWLLPGLWSIVYSLGVFASYRLLPHAVFWVAMYYLVAGGACLVLAQGPHALSPWSMGLTFGVGQLIAAAVLYWSLERQHD